MPSFSVSTCFILFFIFLLLIEFLICCNYREGDDHSRDEGHHGDEEDSAATSISDAMIDDEIADQPGLVMLGQVKKLPIIYPLRNWRRFNM